MQPIPATVSNTTSSPKELLESSQFLPEDVVNLTSSGESVTQPVSSEDESEKS